MFGPVARPSCPLLGLDPEALRRRLSAGLPLSEVLFNLIIRAHSPMPSDSAAPSESEHCARPISRFGC